MLNTLPVGYSCAKQLCEISCSVFGDAEKRLFNRLKTKSELAKPEWEEVYDRRVSWDGNTATGNTGGSTGWVITARVSWSWRVNFIHPT